MFDDLRDLYQEVIIEHSKRPRNLRHPEHFNREAVGHNPNCGDALVVYLMVDEDGVIRDCAFNGKGCAISTASASLMTEILKGKTRAEAEELFAAFHALATGEGEPDTVRVDEDDMDRLRVLSGVRQYPMRVKCATLAWHTMHAAMEGESRVSTE